MPVRPTVVIKAATLGGKKMAMLEPSTFEGQRFILDSGLRRRAVKLARSGACRDLCDIGRRLKLEGYTSTIVEASLAERSISDEIERILHVANDS
jgi:hypothetical protein